MFVSADVVAQVLLLGLILERGGVELDVPVRPLIYAANILTL